MGQLKIIELIETYTGIRFQDIEKIQSESQSLPRTLGGRLCWFKRELKTFTQLNV